MSADVNRPLRHLLALLAVTSMALAVLVVPIETKGISAAVMARVASAGTTSPAGAAPATKAAAFVPLSCTVQRASLRLCGARTDNYKDCYNAPDADVERRTWLSFGQLAANGARYRKDVATQQFGSTVAVTRISGTRSMPRRAFVRVRTLSGNVELANLRSGPPAHLWGPLLQIADPAALASAPVRIELQLRSASGQILARAPASYRRDGTLAAAAAGTAEHNGPGGRWYVSGLRTPTDAEVGAVHVCP